MSAKITASADGTYGSLGVGATEAFRFGADTSGQLAGFRNVLINGDMRINQRGVTIAAAANGSYGPDRWKKVDASNMTQIVEAGNFHPSKTYTLSGTNVTTQQLTSPASGNWTLPNIPITATNVQLEEGSIATPFEQRPIGLELSLCQRYYYQPEPGGNYPRFSGYSSPAGILHTVTLPVQMRMAPAATVLTGPGWGLSNCTAPTLPNANTVNSVIFNVAVTALGTYDAYAGPGNVAFTASAEL